MKKSSLIKNSSILVLLTVISKITGFLRDLLIAASFGTTYETDAYNIALTVPVLAFALIGVSIKTIFIPIFVRQLEENDKSYMFKAANKVLNILIILGFIMFSILEVSAGKVVSILAPDIKEETYILAVNLTKICMVNLFFLSLYSVFNALLQSLQEFIPAALIGIVINVPIIIYILLKNEHGIFELVFVTVLGYLLQVVIQVPWLIKHKYKYTFIIDFRDKMFKKLPLLLVPVAIGTGINQINTLVDQIMASSLQEGSISAINLSDKVNTLAYGIFASAIVTAVYPVLAMEVNNIKKFKYYITKSICNISLITIPTAVATMVLSNEIISILFKRGVFNVNSVEMTSTSLFFLSIGVIFYGIRDIVNRAFYSMQDTKSPMKNSFIGLVFNIILDILLIKPLGIGGLSLATSLSSAAIAIFLFRTLSKKIGTIMEKKYVNDMIKMFLSSAFMGIIIYFTKNYIMNFDNRFLFINFIILIILGVLSYIIFLKLVHTITLEENINIFLKKVKNIANKKMV